MYKKGDPVRYVGTQRWEYYEVASDTRKHLAPGDVIGFVRYLAMDRSFSGGDRRRTHALMRMPNNTTEYIPLKLLEPIKKQCMFAEI